MPWTRLDDSMLNHPKLTACSPTARWLFVSTVLYARQNHTGGELTVHQMASHLRAQGCMKRHLDELVEVGLIESMEAAFAIHDYTDYNPLSSTERVRKHRAMKRDETVTETVVKRDETEVKRDGNAPRARATAPGPDPGPVPVVTPLSPSPLVPPHTAEALAIATAWEDRFGRPLSRTDLEWVEGMVGELRVLTAEEFVKAMADQDAYNAKAGRELTKSVKGYGRQWRHRNAKLRDEGRRDRDHAPADWLPKVASL